MSLWRQLSRGLRALVHRSATDRDIADEVEQYVDDAAAAFEASGLAPEDARRAARRQLGSLTAVHEQVRAYGWEHIVETTLSDIRHAAPTDTPLSRSRDGCCSDVGARHRCKHRDFQRRQSRPLPAAALPRCAPADADLGRPGRIAPGCDLRNVSRAPRTDSLVRIDDRHAAGAANVDRRRGTRAARRSVRQRGLLPRAGCAACTGTRFRGDGRRGVPAKWSVRSHRQRHAVATAFQRRSNTCRAADPAQ